MPIVSFAYVRFLEEREGVKATSVPVASRTERDIFRELALLLPQLDRWLLHEGEPRPLFGLIRDRDGEDLRCIDGPVDDSEQLSLLLQVAS